MAERTEIQMSDRDREKYYEPVYTICKLCGIVVIHDDPPQCGDSDCPFKDEWADPPLTESQKAQNKEHIPSFLEIHMQDRAEPRYDELGEPHPDSPDYVEEQD